MTVDRGEDNEVLNECYFYTRTKNYLLTCPKNTPTRYKFCLNPQTPTGSNLNHPFLLSDYSRSASVKESYEINAYRLGQK